MGSGRAKDGSKGVTTPGIGEASSKTIGVSVDEATRIAGEVLEIHNEVAGATGEVAKMIKVGYSTIIAMVRPLEGSTRFQARLMIAIERMWRRSLSLP